MKLIIAIATIITSILAISHYQATNTDSLFTFWQARAYAQNPQNIIAIRDLKPGKIQAVSGAIVALHDDELILEDNTSSVVVKISPKTQNIKLFQGEKINIIGIYQHEKLEAFQITRANGELIKLDSADEH